MEKQTSTKVQTILEDLYLIDPALRQKEDKLISVIEEIIKSEPDIKINQAFVDHLRERLFTEIRELEEKKPKLINLSFYFKNIAYASMGAAVILLIVFIYPAYLDKGQEDKPGLIALGDRAFGSLQLDFSSQSVGELGATKDRMEMGTDVLGLGAADSSAMIGSDTIFIPRPIETKQYQYVYRGEALNELDLNSVSSLVYRRVIDKNLARRSANTLATIGGLPINLNSFSEKELIHFNFNQEKDFGYSVAVNLANNTLSVFDNWSTWPQPYQDCYDEDCLASLRLGADDMLTDNQLISLANNFIENYGVDLSNYSSPRVSAQSKLTLLREASDNNYYPEYMTVIYPLLIDNQKVFDSHGIEEGLQISVNLREKRVSGLSNLNFSSYQSSSYELINDLNKINPLLERGGLYPDYRYTDGELIEVELADPQIALVKTWLPSADKRSSYELFLPGLIFPVKETPNEYFYRQAVIIPLVEEVFQDSLSNLKNMTGQREAEILPMPRIIPDQIVDWPTEPEPARDDDNYRIMPIE